MQIPFSHGRYMRSSRSDFNATDEYEKALNGRKCLQSTNAPDQLEDVGCSRGTTPPRN
ncbi:hypothetical protein M378DRAFT_162531, partial [Amanita muscaria Koide BX008]